MKIPIYNRQVSPSGQMAQVQRPRADAPVFDSSGGRGLMRLGQAVSGAGNELSKIAQDELARQVIAKADESLLKAQAAYNERQLKIREEALPMGMDGLEYVEAETRKALEEAQAEVLRQNTSPQGKQYVKGPLGRWAIGALSNARNYALAENKKARLQVNENKFNDLLEQAKNLGMPPEFLRAGMMDLHRSYTAQFGKDTGLFATRDEALRKTRVEAMQSFLTDRIMADPSLCEKALPAPKGDAGWGKHENVTKEIQDWWKPEEYEAFRGKALKLAEAAKKQKSLEFAASVYEPMRLRAFELAYELGVEEANGWMEQQLDSLEDVALRKSLRADWSGDLKGFETRRDARDYQLSRDYLQLAGEQGLSMAEAEAHVRGIPGMSPEGAEKLRANLRKDVNRLTPEKALAAAELRRKIDRHEIADEEGIYAAAQRHDLTGEQVKSSFEYLNTGGNAGRLTQSRLDNAWRALNRNDPAKAKKVPSDLFELVQNNLEPGKPVTDERIRQNIASLYLSGESMASGWFRDRDESYAEALRKGQDDSWLPDLEREDKIRLDALFAANPETAEKWLTKYGGNVELAKRAYLKKEKLGSESQAKGGRK
jgi:hypothetical protein